MSEQWANFSSRDDANLTPTFGMTPSTRRQAALVTPLYITISVSMLTVIVFLFGVLGNALVIYVVTRHKGMRTATNLFLTNLSVADLLVLLVCMPSFLAEFYAKDVWYLGDAMCKLVAFLENSMVHASILTITAISVERFYAICWPLRAQFICTNQRTIRIIYVLWACAVGFSLPFLVMSYTELARFHDGRQVTVCRTPVDETWKRVYVIGISILFFCVPFILLVLIYTAIALQLSVQAKALGSDADSSSIANYKLRRQVVVLMVAIIILFFICNLPIRVLSVWSIFTSKQQKVSIGFEAYLNISSFARVMFYLNSAGNPIVYNIVSSRFRESCKRILSRSKKRKIKRRRSSLIFHFDAKNRQNRSMFHKQNIRQSKL